MKQSKILVGYCRVSTDNQKEEGTIEIQEKSLKRYKRMGLREIARELNKRNVPTARGGIWHGRTIKYMLENPLYKGTAHYKDNKVKNKELALI